jgi:hypothetical protein
MAAKRTPAPEPTDEPGEDEYPKIRAAVEAREQADTSTTWDLVDALLAEARTTTGGIGRNGADGTQLVAGEMERISKFIERAEWASGSYAPIYLAHLHQMGRWAAGHPEVRDHPATWAMKLHAGGVPVADALTLMTRCRREPLPAGVRTRQRRLNLLAREWKAPANLDAKRDGEPAEDEPPVLAMRRQIKRAERASTNLAQLVRWAEQAEAEELLIFVEDSRALVERLVQLVGLGEVTQPEPVAEPEAPKAKRQRRKATTA